MTLSNILRAIRCKGICILTNLTGIASEAHSAALILNINLRKHQVNDRIRSFSPELRAVGFLHAAYIPGKFNNGTLHAEAKSEERQSVLTSILNGTNLALNATLTETAGNKDTLNTGENLIQISTFGLNVLRINPGNLNFTVVRNTGMMESFGNGHISIRQLNILSDNSNPNLLGRVLNLVHHTGPFFHVSRRRIHVQLFQYNSVESFTLHHQRNFINGGAGTIFNYCININITEQSQLLLHILGDRLLCTADQNIRLYTYATQLFNTMLGRLGLQLTGS